MSVCLTQVGVAVHADNGKVVVCGELFGLVSFSKKHALAVVAPGLKIVWIIRIFDEPSRSISHGDVMPTHDCHG